MIFYFLKLLGEVNMTLKYENPFTGEKGYYKKGIRDEKHKVTYKN